MKIETCIYGGLDFASVRYSRYGSNSWDIGRPPVFGKSTETLDHREANRELKATLGDSMILGGLKRHFKDDSTTTRQSCLWLRPKNMWGLMVAIKPERGPPMNTLMINENMVCNSGIA